MPLYIRFIHFVWIILALLHSFRWQKKIKDGEFIAGVFSRSARNVNGIMVRLRSCSKLPQTNYVPCSNCFWVRCCLVCWLGVICKFFYKLLTFIITNTTFNKRMLLLRNFTKRLVQQRFYMQKKNFFNLILKNFSQSFKELFKLYTC